MPSPTCLRRLATLTARHGAAPGSLAPPPAAVEGTARALGVLSASMALAHPLAHAHSGHGQAGSHWHATDLFGFLAGLALVGAVLWWRGRE